MTSQSKRPTFLTVLCILTFIGSGLGLLFSLLGLVAAGAVESFASSIPGMSEVAGLGLVRTLINVVLIGGSLYGAIMMFQLKKLGFYIYAVANVVLLILGFGIVALIITGGFIAMYAVNLKAMK